MKRKKTLNPKTYIPNSPLAGFTFIELLVTLAIVVFIAVSAIFVINPPRQLAKGRNQERVAGINLILSAVGQNIFSNRGAFSCSNGPIPTSTTRMASSTGNYNIGPCLVPIYLDKLPFDPATTGAKFVNASNYDTAYFIIQNAATGRVTVSAPAAELGETIEVTR